MEKHEMASGTTHKILSKKKKTGYKGCILYFTTKNRDHMIPRKARKNKMLSCDILFFISFYFYIIKYLYFIIFSSTHNIT